MFDFFDVFAVAERTIDSVCLIGSKLWLYGLDRIGSKKMDPCPTLSSPFRHQQQSSDNQFDAFQSHIRRHVHLTTYRYGGSSKMIIGWPKKVIHYGIIIIKPVNDVTFFHQIWV